MKIKRLFIISFVLLVVQVADAQKILEGLVLDGETLEPIVGATVSDGSKGKPLSVTNADGRFQIPNNHYASLRITYVGYKPLVTAPAKDGRYMLQTEMRNVGEVADLPQLRRLRNMPWSICSLPVFPTCWNCCLADVPVLLP